MDGLRSVRLNLEERSPSEIEDCLEGPFFGASDL